MRIHGIVFDLQVGGTTGTRVLTWIAGNEIVFNEASNDLDFRFEGATDANLLFLDGGTDRVGIGTATPATKLDIDTGSNTTGLRLRGLAETVEIADIYIGAGGHLIIDNTNGTGTNAYIDLRPEDDSFGLVLRESDGTGVASYANFYVADATDDYLAITVNSATDGDALVVTASNRVGIGTLTPATKLDVLSTTEQLRLSYDASNYSSFTTSSGGDLTIAPSGGDTSITGTLGISGDLTASGAVIMERTNVVIASDTISASGRSYVKVDVESGTTDDLSTISDGIDGQILVIQTLQNARDVTIKDGVGNISCAGDFTLTTFHDKIMLIYNGVNALWHEISRSDNA